MKNYKININTDLLKYALFNFDNEEQKKFFEKVGANTKDLNNYIDGFLDESEQVINDFIEQLFINSIQDTINI